jgi:transposase-like protein
MAMDEEIKRWTARRKAAVVLEIIQGKTTVAEVSRQFDLTPSEIEDWVDQGKAGMENALRPSPRTSGSSTSANSRNCRRRMAKR